MVLALRSSHGGGVESGMHSGAVLGADEQHVITAGVRTPSFADVDRDDRPGRYLEPPKPGIPHRRPALAIDRHLRLAPVGLTFIDPLHVQQAQSVSEGIVVQRDPLLHRADITAVLPPDRGGKQCARLFALNRQHDCENDRGQHRQDKQVHSSPVVVGPACIAVAGYTSLGVGGVTVERRRQLCVSGVEIMLAQRLGLGHLSRLPGGGRRHRSRISRGGAGRHGLRVRRGCAVGVASTTLRERQLEHFSMAAV